MSYQKACDGFAALGRENLGLAEAAILLEVASWSARWPLTISQISQALKQPLSSISRQTWLLAEHGYLAYHRSKTDRRVTEVSITPKGLKLAQHFFQEPT